ncbi:MAG: hypothetical protein ABH816_00950 [Candidatus Levyibacteriota bacterium]
MAVKQETLIVPERKTLQIPEGVVVDETWGIGDLHLHVRDVGGEIEEIFERARENGMVFAVTEHDNRQNFDLVWELAEKHGIENQVLAGVEATLLIPGQISPAHVLIYFPDKSCVPNTKVYNEYFGRGKNLFTAAKAIHEMGGFSVLAHPTSPLTFSAGFRSVQRSFDDPTIVQPDGIEVLNATLAGQTALANALALFATGKFSAFGGSDGRESGQLGYCQTRFPGKTKKDLVETVRKKETVAQGNFYDLGQMVPVASRQVTTIFVRTGEMVSSFFTRG